MPAARQPLLVQTPSGLYCPAADLYLDPWRPVSRALITHAHSDHARAGSAAYITHRTTAALLHQRLGTTPSQVTGLEYGEVFTARGVQFSLHPAGHVPGSAQILVEFQGERWVFSGDYKTEDDGCSTPLEVLKCDTFISECTFGLPIFSWQPQSSVFGDIHSWWRSNRSAGVTSVVSAYSLGKAQRVLTHLDHSIGPIVVHPAIERINQALGIEVNGADTGLVIRKEDAPMVVVPPAVVATPWLRRFGELRTAAVSGWMAIGGMRRRRGIDKGFVLSDHADFRGLHDVITATGASQVLLTHGYTAQFGRYLSEQHPTLRVAELGAEFASEVEE
jgi:putative mRNA 3-end processing factor